MLAALKPRRSSPERALDALYTAGPAQGRPLLVKLRGALANRGVADALETWRFVYDAFAVDAGMRDKRFADTIVRLDDVRNAPAHVWPRGVLYLHPSDAPDILTACGKQVATDGVSRVERGGWHNTRTDRCRDCASSVKRLNGLAELCDPVALAHVLTDVHERSGHPEGLSAKSTRAWSKRARAACARLLDENVPLSADGLTARGAQALWETLPVCAAAQAHTEPLVLARAGITLDEPMRKRLGAGDLLSPTEAQNALMALMPDPAKAAAGYTSEWLEDAARARRVAVYRAELRTIVGS